jgi:16S rRNA (uracil1498-N3)-methyltransferase
MRKSMKIFFHPHAFTINDLAALSAEEAQHAIKVLRCQPGEEVALLNGRGQKAIGRIIDNSIKNCQIEILSVFNKPDKHYHIHMAIANLKKRDRIEWFVEKAVELGIDEITVFSSDRTEKKRLDKQRLDKIALSALKQSGNLQLPEIHANLTFSELCRTASADQKFIAHCLTDDTALLKQTYTPGRNVLILIGPEGDFTPKEIDEALGNGFIPANLGPLRLRSETAAFAAALTIHILNQ